MNKLLSVELKRAIISPILWIGLITVIAVNAYGIMFNTYGFDIYTTSFLLSNSGLICIILALFIPLHIGHDFEVRTINNKISAGYTRKQIYITEVIISLICATSLFVIDIASVFLCSSIMWSYVKKKYKLNMPFLRLAYPARASAFSSNAA